MFKKILNITPWVVSIVGLIVMFGWLIDSRLIIQIHSSFTSMKFLTALLFFLMGFQLFEINNYLIKGKILRLGFYSNLILSTSVIIVLSLFVHMAPNLFDNILLSIGNSKKYDPWTSIPHIPSLLTLSCFIFIQILQFIIVFLKDCINKSLLVIGILLCVFGGIVLIGYIYEIPWLFYSTIIGGAMAIHSAILFIIIGIYFISIRRMINK